MSSLARRSTPLTGAISSEPPRGLSFVALSVMLHGVGVLLVTWLPGFVIERPTSLPIEVAFEVIPDPAPVAAPERAPEPEPDSEVEPVVLATPRERPRARVEPTVTETPAPTETAPANVGVSSTGGGLAVAAPEGGGGEGPLSLVPRPSSAATVGTAQAAGPAGPDPRVLARAWMMRVNRAILERAVRDYPRAARRAELEGTVLVSIAVANDGRITSVRIENGAGYETLDRAAVAAVEAVGQLPPPPDLFTRRGRPLTMPITYRLR